MHDLALKSFNEARGLIEKELGPGHKETATILINIGLVHLAKREYAPYIALTSVGHYSNIE
jgi:hypothetical protein